jgi:hypothetical protein
MEKKGVQYCRKMRGRERHLLARDEMPVLAAYDDSHLGRMARHLVANIAAGL